MLIGRIFYKKFISFGEHFFKINYGIFNSSTIRSIYGHFFIFRKKSLY